MLFPGLTIYSCLKMSKVVSPCIWFGIGLVFLCSYLWRCICSRIWKWQVHVLDLKLDLVIFADISGHTYVQKIWRCYIHVLDLELDWVISEVMQMLEYGTSMHMLEYCTSMYCHILVTFRKLKYLDLCSNTYHQRGLGLRFWANPIHNTWLDHGEILCTRCTPFCPVMTPPHYLGL